MRYGVRYRARMRDTDVVIPRDCAASQTHQRNIGAPLQLADVFKPRTTLGSRWRFQHDPPGARPESPPPASSKVSGLAANADPKNSVTSRRAPDADRSRETQRHAHRQVGELGCVQSI
jgi:hypothetical protein